MQDPSGSVAITGVAATPYVRWEDHLSALLSRLDLPADGVVQVGAHQGQEVAAMVRCGFRRLVLMEPNRDHGPALRAEIARHPGPSLAGRDPAPVIEIVAAAAGAARGRAILHVTEHDQQASVLPPIWPLIETRQDSTPVIPVRELQAGCNVLVVDVQGAELDVLAGCDLDRMDLAVIEGSTTARYQGGATTDTVSAYMTERGWSAAAVFPHSRRHVVDVAWVAPVGRSKSSRRRS